MLAKGIAIGIVVGGGTRVGYNALTHRPLDEGLQGDVARGAIGGALLGIGGATFAVADATMAGAAAKVGGSAMGAGQAIGSRADAISNLRRLGPENVALLRKFFKDGQVPEGLSREALSAYRSVAEHAIHAGRDKLGVQAQRIEMIDDALNRIP